MHVLETFEAQSNEGPCLDCYRSGQPIVNLDLTTAHSRWPSFTPLALAAGFRSVHALPMHVRTETIGALYLFRAHEGRMDESDINAAQLSRISPVFAILQYRADLDLRALNDQLDFALNSRIVIEQAKGIVGEKCRIEMAQAFSLLRTYARSNGRRLADVARDIIDGTLRPESL